MQGLELCEKYFNEACLPVIRNVCPEWIPRLAFGLAGDGSECYGYDDLLSRDHDFGPSFAIWVRDEDWEEMKESLQIIYDTMPRSFQGFAHRNTSAQGSGRVGPMTISTFYTRFTGCPRGPETIREWNALPEYYAAKAVNGRVFLDECGEFSAIREKIRNYYPEEVRWKKMASRLVTMAQSGQYNYPRELQRGDTGAAFLAMREFLYAFFSLAHLLEGKYMPYYKWAWTSFRELGAPYGELVYPIESMMKSPVDPRNEARIERICVRVKEILLQRGYVTLDENFLDPVGWELYGRITDPFLRSRHIMEQ